MAAPMTGRPARTATGSMIAPTKAVAGLGQTNQDVTIMPTPRTQKATLPLTIALAAGRMIR